MDDAPKTAMCWEFELVPLLKLPSVDLSLSVKSRVVRSKLVHKLIRVVGSSRLPFVGYLVCLVLATMVFFVPPSVGQPMGLVGFLAGLPAVSVSIFVLRYEIVLVLLKTYDIWFFGVVSTVVSVVLGMQLHDVRVLLVLVSWFSFLINIFVDANLHGLRRLWVANVLSALCFLVIAGSVSAGLTRDLFVFDLLRINGRTLPAASLTRDGLLSMTVVILRNAFRHYQYVIRRRVDPDTMIAGRIVKCISYRCRLQLKSIVRRSSSRRPSSRPSSRPKSSTPRPPTALDRGSRSRLFLIPFLLPLDARHTLLPLGSSFWTVNSLHRYRRLRWALKSIGVSGLSVSIATIAVYLVNPRLTERADVKLAATTAPLASMIFTGACLALCQRQLLAAIVTSFDFVFTASQVSLLHLAVADLCRWNHAMTASLVATWNWCLWALIWDALTPPMRRSLRLSQRFAAWVCTSLLLVMVASATMIFAVLSPRSLHDRAIAHVKIFDKTIEFRALSWYFSSAATISPWTIRVLSRMWRAKENELVVLDGPVAYEALALVQSVQGKQQSSCPAVGATTASSRSVVPLDA